MLFSIIVFFIFLIKNNSLSFQDNLLNKIIENKKEKNIMVSPLSIYQVLGLISNGASGNTLKEILQVLFPGQQVTDNFVEKINTNIKEIISHLESEKVIDSNSRLNLNCEGEDKENCVIKFYDVNGIFIKRGYKLKEDFTNICKNYNTSFFELIDAKQINDFCSENTNGKIEKVIEKIDPRTVLILINAIYFKGTWLEKFFELDTKKRNFKNYDGKVVKVDTMYKDFRSQMFYEDEKVQIISLPYISNKLNFRMIIILPNSQKYSSPLDYLNKEKINFSEVYSKLKSDGDQEIHLYLPKFNYSFDIDLINILKDMGMKLAFNESAEIEKLCEGVNTYIGEFAQNTYINLNEEGTEAAAVTSAISYTENVPNKVHYMYVNHSFIYMIQSDTLKDSENNYIMPFIGIVNKLDGEESNDTNDNDSDKKDESDKNEGKDKNDDSDKI